MRYERLAKRKRNRNLQQKITYFQYTHLSMFHSQAEEKDSSFLLTVNGRLSASLSNVFVFMNYFHHPPVPMIPSTAEIPNSPAIFVIFSVYKLACQDSFYWTSRSSRDRCSLLRNGIR